MALLSDEELISLLQEESYEGDVEQLQDDNELLQEEFEELGRENMKCKAAQSLPWELLHLIFQYTVAPSTIMVPVRCIHSVWSLNVLTSKRLITVCRDWYEAGIKFLYTVVAIYWMQQLFSLLWTLQSRPHLALKLVSIDIGCFVPPDDAETFDGALGSLASTCPKLTRLSTRFIHVHPTRFPRILPAFSSVPLTHITIHSDDPHSSTNFVHLFAEHLVSLNLYARDSVPMRCRIQRAAELSTPNFSSLLFPRLQYFQHDLEYYWLEHIRRKWVLPALCCLTCRVNSRHASFSANLEFMRTHGKQVSTLLFHSPTEREPPAVDVKGVQSILSEMRQLRHLIIPGFWVIPSFDDLSLPQIQYLDLISSPLETDGLPPINDQEHRFPNLTSYRLLDSSLLSLPWITTRLPPTKGERYEFHFPGIDITGNEYSLLGASSFEKNFLGEGMDFASDDGMDSDWVPTSDNDTSSSESDLEANSEISDDELEECKSLPSWFG
ncbi:hypothetical protein F5879DRAFT_1038872 [Lentinula edodes]|nr:hypothetical protein F5879DRAFT_1038872 [Lentinula edodes]